MSLTDYGEDWMMNLFTTSGTKYLALFTTVPAEDAVGVEVSGGGYARLPITLTASQNGEVFNTVMLQYAPATAPWGTVVGFGVCNAATGENIIWYGLLTDTIGNPTPKSITTGDIFQVPASDLVLGID